MMCKSKKSVRLKSQIGLQRCKIDDDDDDDGDVDISRTSESIEGYMKDSATESLV